MNVERTQDGRAVVLDRGRQGNLEIGQGCWTEGMKGFRIQSEAAEVGQKLRGEREVMCWEVKAHLVRT